MKRWVLAAGLLAAALVPPAAAADLDGVPPPPWRGGAYGDPRWPHRAPPPPSYYDEDDDDGPYGAPPATRRYSYAPPGRYAPPNGHAPPGGACVRSDQVREHLTRHGWRDFHDGQAVSGSLVTLRARRPSGRLFELTLHRCSGEVVDLRPLQLRPFGPYAYRQPDGPYGYGPWRRGPETAPYGYGDPWQGRPYAYQGPRRWDRDSRD